MSLTLSDVVESRTRQLASSPQGAATAARDASRAAQTRRERFSLDDTERSPISDSREPQSPSAKAESSKPKDASVQTPRPSTADSQTDRAPRSETRKQAAAAKPATHDQTAKPQSGQANPSPSDPVSSEGGTASTDANDGVAAGEHATTAEKQAELGIAAAPAIVTFIVPQQTIAAPTLSTPATTAPLEDGDLDVAAASNTPTSAVAAGPASGKTSAAAAATSVFDAALAVAMAEGSAGDASAAAATPPAAAAGSAAAPSAASDFKATAAAQPQAPTPTASAPVPLGAVPMTIGLRALGASNRFEIKLDPKELGRIDVSIDIDKDTNTVGARLVVDRPETLALLQRDASSLQQALSQTGLDASSAITFSLRGGEGDGRRNGNESGANTQARGTGQANQTGLAADMDQTSIDLMPLRALRGLGRVDIRI